VLLRRIHAVDGQPRVRVALDIRADFAHHAMKDVSRSDTDRGLVLEISDHELRANPVRPEEAWGATERAWAQAVPAITGTLADARTPRWRTRCCAA
jgi:hypothetical protein